MLIFGRNSDDKGTQLERLTLRLLQSFGYRNCATSEIRAGGAELDVTAELAVQHMPSPVIQRALCECKAYRSPVSMDHWLKFLGKLMCEELQYPTGVQGLFIALSGVNGNVRGHFADLRSRKPNVNILSGDDLQEVLDRLFTIARVSDVSRRIVQLSERTPIRFELAYYDNSLYWVVVFQHNVYALLGASGETIHDATAAILNPMMAAELEAGSYINLEQEAHARQRRRMAQSIALSQMMLGSGSAVAFLPELDLTDGELRQAASDLANEQLIDFDDATQAFTLPTDSARLLDVYAYMLDGSRYQRSLGCEFYDRHIDDAMLAEMLNRQFNVPLTEDERREVLDCVRLSPSALKHLARPIDIIVEHRRTASGPNLMMDNIDRRVLRRNVLALLRYDFQRVDLHEYFHRIRNVVEMETAASFILKSNQDLLLEMDTRERIGIGELSPEYAQRFVLVEIVDEHPEPWERQRIADTNESSAEPEEPPRQI